jgi:hypothetical protein
MRSRIRGRHKLPTVSHILTNQSAKGAIHAPSSTLGIYQASQNMCTTHLRAPKCQSRPRMGLLC